MASDQDMSVMDSQGATTIVAEQYEKWIYPEPIEDLQEYHDSGYVDASAPRDVHLLYWPDGLYEREKENMTFLIAGCGANAAARYAFEHPDCQIVGIDLSSASLDHERKLQEKHNLTNLTLHQMRLQDVAELNQEFDLIECTGVLHHLANPIEGALALKDVLKKPHGVMSVMLYALYGRTGAYMMQDFFHRLGFTQSDEDVAVVKEAVNVVPRSHPLELFARNNLDFGFDAGIVDMFLHNVDHAYTVEQCLAFSAQAGLAFQGWLDNFYYYPEGQIPVTKKIYPRVHALPDIEKWQVMELFHGAIKMHNFYLTHPERDERSYGLDFEGPEFLDYVPYPRINRFHEANPAENQPAMIQRLPFPPLPLSDVQLALYAACDKQRTVREIIKAAKVRGQRQEAEQMARNFFRSLWNVGYVKFKIPSV